MLQCINNLRGRIIRNKDSIKLEEEYKDSRVLKALLKYGFVKLAEPPVPANCEPPKEESSPEVEAFITLVHEQTKTDPFYHKLQGYKTFTYINANCLFV